MLNGSTAHKTRKIYSVPTSNRLHNNNNKNVIITTRSSNVKVYGIAFVERFKKLNISHFNTYFILSYKRLVFFETSVPTPDFEPRVTYEFNANGLYALNRSKYLARLRLFCDSELHHAPWNSFKNVETLHHMCRLVSFSPLIRTNI